MNFNKIIKGSIDKYGHHITFVASDVEPRYAYTIGLSKKMGFELIFAGGIFFMQDEVLKIINSITDKLITSSITDVFKVDDLGSFRLFKVDQSWSSLMMLGFFDYYQQKNVEAFQILPDSVHYTMDIPDMSTEWLITSDPIWKWLKKDWDYPTPKTSKVITNINSLKGGKITEVMRWEEDEWEAFAGSGDEVQKSDIRIVSLATILGIDKTLLPILNLEIGKGVWRDEVELKWHKWN